MVADATFMHDGRHLYRNEEFNTDAENAADLRALGMAHEKPGGLVEAAKRIYRTRNMAPE
jgi:hypothetical protein